jgi:Short C-terminal domain
MSVIRKSVYLLSTVAFSVLSTACTTVTPAPVSVQEDSNHFVRIEGRYGDERRKRYLRFEHPFILTVAEWERLLTGIQVQSRKDTLIFTPSKNPPELAFSPEQVANLSQGLQQAFSRAHPDEFVVFGFSQSRSPSLSEITTGGWFVEGQRLHLVLANYRHSVSMKHVRDQLWQNPLHPNTSPAYEIVPGPAQSLGSQKGFVGLLSAETPELLIDYKAQLEATPVPPSVLSPSKPLDVPAPALSIESSLEERLRALKKLRDQGLITEDEYRDKKKQLLNRL